MHGLTHRGPPLASAALVALLAACTSLPAGLGGAERVDKVQQEQFGTTTTHSRDFGAPGPATCEAARRALLSQGYVISLADADHVNGKKNFQPEPATHMEVEFHIVCAPADRQGRKSIAFVNALQDRYALKKSNNSASLGVGMLGSVSLPFSSSDDAMVRVASETISTQTFYDRFFALVDRYLIAEGSEEVVPDPKSLPEPRVPAPGPRPAATPMPPAAASAADTRSASAP